MLLGNRYVKFPLYLLDAKNSIRLIKITETLKVYDTATVRGSEQRLQLEKQDLTDVPISNHRQ